MKAYASRTGTRRNLAALRTAGWGLFVSAAGVHRDEGFQFIIDNGAWTSYTRGEVWTAEKFEMLLSTHAHSERCEGIVAPDVVCGGAASWRLSLDWLPRLLDYGPRVYLPVQPGVTPSDLRGVIGPRVGVFVGGESAWKEATVQLWAHAAHEHGAVCHVGRVNSLRRLVICKAAGADSFDGSGPSRYEKHLHEMQAAREIAVQLGLRMTSDAELLEEMR